MPEQCAFCGNKHLTKKSTRYLHQRDQDMLFVENVPCMECDFCGEQYFDIQVLRKIKADHQDITAHRKQPDRFVRVAVEEFSSKTA